MLNITGLLFGMLKIILTVGLIPQLLILNSILLEPGIGHIINIGKNGMLFTKRFLQWAKGNHWQ